MRILLDEGVNPRLRLAFPGDQVNTVAEMGWRALSNGRLLKQAASRFDLFVTLDQNVQFQNAIKNCPLGILILITRLNNLSAYRPQFSEIRDAAMQTKPGQVNSLRIQQP